jgi:putative copper export protein
MTESVNSWYAAARGVHLAACILLLGVWIFDRWIIAGSGDPRIAQASRRIGRWLLAIGLPAALLSGVAWFYLAAAGMKDPDMPMRFSAFRVVWTETQFGHVWQLRSILWIAAAVLFPPLVRRGRVRVGVPYASGAGSPPPLPSPGVPGEGDKFARFRSLADWLSGAVATALLASLAWAGHGATGPAPGWHRTADVVHLLVCAAWPAGLIPLFLLLWQLTRADEPIPLAAAARIIRRFSATAFAAVVILAGTGTLNAWCLIGSFDALYTSRYGQVLLLKIAVFLIIILLGASNLLIGKPRLLRLAAAPAGDGESRPIARRMMWIVAIEALLGLGILAIVGVLGLLIPGRM